jgi:hypothetical protein
MAAGQIHILAKAFFFTICLDGEVSRSHTRTHTHSGTPLDE